MRFLFAFFLMHFASAASAEKTLNVYSPEQIQIGKVSLDDDAVSGCWKTVGKNCR